MPTLSDLLTAAQRRLRDSSPTPELDARVLLEHATGRTRVDALARPEIPVSESQAATFFAFLERRAAGEPVAYITGRKEFYGRTFAVSPAVLVPRPDTEIIVERVLQTAPPVMTLLDLGTGSGCIAITLALELRRAAAPPRVVAVDKSRAALEVARRNAASLGAAGLIDFRESDWFSAIAAGERFECIVSNPPYVARTDSELSPETKYEPESALFAEEEGLQCLRALFEQAWLFLLPGGHFLLEIGSNQRSALENLFRERGWGSYYEPLQFFPDLGGRDRVVGTRRKQ